MYILRCLHIVGIQIIHVLFKRQLAHKTTYNLMAGLTFFHTSLNDCDQ